MPNAPILPAAVVVRARLARAALGLAPHPADARVGPLELRAYQRHAAARLRYALRHYRVALLADDVGLGKTAVALALVRDTPDAVVVAPAAIRPQWTAALRAAGLTRRILTTEALGRAQPRLSPPAPLLVVDEAHHFRNPRTHRWRALASLAADARLLLLSATPVHNRPDDLAALFALTLGAHADTLDAPTLARLVVRRAAADVYQPAHAATRGHAPGRPSVAPTVWLDLDDAPALLDALRAVPPTLAPTDGSATPDLDRYTLVRLWTSSDAALRAGLRRRLARTFALRHTLDAGRPPSRADLRALTRALPSDPMALQLSLIVPGTDHSEPARTARDQLDAYEAGLRHVLDVLRDACGDQRRVAHLRAIGARHPGARIVAFSHSSDTVRALYHALAPDGRVAMLTATGGRIASGPISRADVLARFAPLGQARADPTAIERIDLLLTTDVLSEGLDLRDACVVVHLDLPWTPARLAQRTGRAVRPGAPAPVIHVYAFRPPPTAARELRLAAHARAKRRAARRTVGTTALEDAVALPDEPASARTRPPAAAQLARDRRLERWSDTEAALGLTPRPPAGAAALRCGKRGYLAVVALPTRLGAVRVPTLVAALGARAPTTAPAVVRRALSHVARAGCAVDPPPECARDARRQLARWVRRQLAHDAVTAAPSVVRDPDRRGHDARTALLARAARALYAATPRERATLAAAAGVLRGALAHPRSSERETAIRDAGSPAATDAEWLTAAARVAVAAPPTGARQHEAPRATLRALVLLID